MRIIAGEARGRRLSVPDGTTTRPTSDRVREAIFNALFSLDMIEGRTYCDLFAGSGALGLEALSRGARAATFVERDRSALAALETNLETLGFGDRATVVRADASRFAATPAGSGFDVVLADPPYDFDRWAELLDDVDASVVVAESDRVIGPHAGWRIVRDRRYGTTVVTMLTSETAPESPTR